jgi:3-hydroxyisobutyrate dehydrogenase-like beta-hydroxyacid dehydrogenase
MTSDVPCLSSNGCADVGEVGSGSKMKLAVNLPLPVYWQALGEALTICKPLNLSCYEEAEAAGIGEADATAVSTQWAPAWRHSVTPPLCRSPTVNQRALNDRSQEPLWPHRRT